LLGWREKAKISDGCVLGVFLMCRHFVPDVPKKAFLMCRHFVPDVPNGVPDVPKHAIDLGVICKTF
jgi:hypothetical protein